VGNKTISKGEIGVLFPGIAPMARNNRNSMVESIRVVSDCKVFEVSDMWDPGKGVGVIVV